MAWARTKLLQFRVTGKEYNKIAKVAKDAGVSMSDILRIYINGKCMRCLLKGRTNERRHTRRYSAKG